MYFYSRGRTKDGREVQGPYFPYPSITPSPIVAKEGDQPDHEVKHVIIRAGFSDWGLPRPLEAVEVSGGIEYYAMYNDRYGEKLFTGDLVKINDSKLAQVEFQEGCFGLVLEETQGFIPLRELFPESIKTLGASLDLERIGELGSDCCIGTV